MSEKSRITFASVNQAKLPFNLVLQGNEGTPAGTIKNRQGACDVRR